jgi:4-amino-4-deoxy-L-arabinose transferase-like glycosyltransferase
MENLLLGILTIALCSLGYALAYRQWKLRQATRALLLIMAAGLLLRVYAASDFYLHNWDERYHALVAKNMMQNPLQPVLYGDPILPYDYRNWAGNHIWVHKQPLPLWAMALSMSILGTHEIALRLPSVLLTVLGIWVTFLIAAHLFNPRVGFVAAFLYSIHGLIIELAAGRVATDHIDIFFLFFIQLAVLFAIKFVEGKRHIYNILCGISIGLAILSKWLPALIVLPIWLLLVLDSKKFNHKEVVAGGLILCGALTLVFLPWQWYIFTAFPAEAQWESSFNFKHLTEVLEGHDGPVYYHFRKAGRLYGELIYLPLVWFAWKVARRWNNYRRLLILTWFLVPYAFFSLAATKMQAYTLFVAPAIFIIVGLFWHYLYFYRNRFRYPWAVLAVLILLLALPVRYSLERVKPFVVRERNPVWAQELRALGAALDGGEKTVIFKAERPIETMFYADCLAYPELPDSLTLQRIAATGYAIYIRHPKEAGAERSKGETIAAGPGISYRRWGK